MKIKFLILPLASLLFSACTIPFLSQSPEKAAEQAVLENCTYDKSICQYMAAQATAFESGLTMTSVMTFANDSEVGETATVTQMDNQGNMQTTASKDGKETSAMVVYNNATYIKDYEDGAWLKMTSDNDEESSPVDTEESIDSIKDQFNFDDMQMVFTKVGEEACDNLTCEIYEMFEQGSELGKTKIWIDTKEHLSRKMEMTLPDGSVNTLIYTYSAVTITEPTPVKEFELPSYDMGQGKMPSQEEIDKMMEDLPVEVPEM